MATAGIGARRPSAADAPDGPLRGYILYKTPGADVPKEAYEIHRLVEEGKAFGMELEVFAPEEFDLVVTRDDRKSMRVAGRERPLPHFILPRMGSATTYFALAVLRHCERLGVPVLNSSHSVEVVKDKLWSIQVLAESSIPIAKTMLVKHPFDVSVAEEHIGYPLVMKALSGSHGRGVFLLESRRNLEDMVDLVVNANEKAGSSLNLILQEFVASSRGRDLRVLTIGGRAVGAMLRTAPEGSFKANISAGGTGAAYALTPEIEWLAVEAARVSGLDISGIDLLFDGDHFRICEANSSPGFEGFEAATGINVARQVLEYVCVRIGRIDKLRVDGGRAPPPPPAAVPGADKREIVVNGGGASGAEAAAVPARMNGAH